MLLFLFLWIFSHFTSRETIFPKFNTEPRVGTITKSGLLPFKPLLTTFLFYSYQSSLAHWLLWQESHISWGLLSISKMFSICWCENINRVSEILSRQKCLTNWVWTPDGGRKELHSESCPLTPHAHCDTCACTDTHTHTGMHMQTYSWTHTHAHIIFTHSYTCTIYQ